MDVDDCVTSSQETASFHTDDEEEEPQDGLSTHIGKINCKEKIVFVVDTSADMGKGNFADNGKEKTNLDVLKKALEMFLLTKSTLNRSHEYALTLLQGDGCFWYQEFTSNTRLIIEALADVEAGGESSKTFSMEDVLQVINENCSIVNSVASLPEYVLRVIFIYGRSTCQIVLSEDGKKLLKNMQKSPYFFFDALCLKSCEEKTEHFQKTLTWMTSLDSNENSYILEASKNPAAIFECMAKLLCHPLQRSPQKHSYHEL